jgi:Na+-driven multidrug efflux pump
VSWVQFPSPSIAITAAILGARAIGAGQFEQVPVILRSGLWANAALPGTLVLLGCALSHWFLGLLITQSAVREQAEHLLHIMLWSLLLFGFQTVLGGIVRASGVVTVAISSACIALARMPAAFALRIALACNGSGRSFR